MMIKLPKEISKASLESQLEKLYNMRNIIKYSQSHISNEYSLNILESKISELEKEIKEKEIINSINPNDKVFDTQEYADKLKNPK